MHAKHDRPDLVVLDLGLPDIDGVEVIRQLRTWTPVPIVVLSGRVDSHDKVDALDAGADDYVTKPFSLDELLARVRAVTRRRARPRTRRPWSRSAGTRSTCTTTPSTPTDDPAETVHLTRTEWQLLEVLLRNPGKLVSQRQLLQEVWGPTYLNETHYLRQYMTHLRRKLEADPARPQPPDHRARHGLPLPAVTGGGATGPPGGDGSTMDVRLPAATAPTSTGPPHAALLNGTDGRQTWGCNRGVVDGRASMVAGSYRPADGAPTRRCVSP